MRLLPTFYVPCCKSMSEVEFEGKALFQIRSLVEAPSYLQVRLGHHALQRKAPFFLLVLSSDELGVFHEAPRFEN